jgi:hypothetical protein
MAKDVNGAFGASVALVGVQDVQSGGHVLMFHKRDAALCGGWRKIGGGHDLC